MRKAMYWLGWAVLMLVPVLFAIQIYLMQDLPRVEPWKWLVALAAVVTIYFARNRDDVLKHHVL